VTFLPFDPAVRSIFRQSSPDPVSHPYFFALTSPAVGATWYFHTASGHFIYYEDINTLVPFPAAPSFRDSKLHFPRLEPFGFKIDGAAPLAQKFQSANSPKLLDYFTECVAFHCGYPPVTRPTLTLYHPVISSPDFLEALTRLPLPRGGIDEFLLGWIAACGSNLRRVWPVLVFAEVKQTDRMERLFARGSFLELIIQFLFLNDASFAQLMETAPQTSPAATVEFFKAIEHCKIAAPPRWLLSIVLCEVERRFPKSRAACVCFANLIFRPLIARVLVARTEDAETAVRFMENVFAFSRNIRPETIAAMTDMVARFKANVELGELEEIRLDHVKSLIAKAFADPAAFCNACGKSTFEADRAAYTRAVDARRFFDL
jgi:hypothetical protein